MNFSFIKAHNLRDQNLLRHHEIEKVLNNKAVLVSDSIKFLHLITIFLVLFRTRCVVHALELYSVSYGACRSEYQFRWSLISKNKYLLFKSYIGYVFSLLRVFLLRNLSRKSGLMILSSDMRKRYLLSEGIEFDIIVVKNKPIIINSDNTTNNLHREHSIALIGNMYSMRSEFSGLVKFAMSQNIAVRCYGLSVDDEFWLKKQKFSNVEIFKRVDQIAIAEILKSTKYALCLYSNGSINNIFSSSSKVFEMLYYGVIPIISQNRGLEAELNILDANFVRLEEVSCKFSDDTNNEVLMYSNACQFSSELKALSSDIYNFLGN